MCIAVPGEIVEIIKNKAKVTMMGVETFANIELIDGPMVGDYVLIHAGCAIQKINREYYDDLNSIYKSMLKEDCYEK